MAVSSRTTAFAAILLQLPNQRRKILHPCLQVRAQGLRDEGGRSRRHMDDANLRVLREKMEVIRIKESLERCYLVHDDHRPQVLGWNDGCAPANINNYKHKERAKQSHFLELLVIVCGTFGLTILSGTLCLCLASVFVHLNQ